MTTTAAHRRRFSRSHPCPICGGYDAAPRGAGVRCHGYTLGPNAYCSREKHAGGLGLEPGSGTYAHRLIGACGCGVAHTATAAPAVHVNGNGHEARRIVAIYPYPDESRVVQYEAVRCEPKRFYQRRQHPDGRWAWGITAGQYRCSGNDWRKLRDDEPEAPGDEHLDAVRLVLYGLPDLAGHAEACIAEGEKDCHTLRASLGLPATCGAMGAGKWRDDYADQLCSAGVRTVYVFRDHDAPGEAHAQAVERSCVSRGLDVRSIHLPGDPKDVTAWLEAGHTADELRAVIAAAVAAPAGSPGSESTPSAEVVCLADVQPEAVQWVWPGRIAVGKLGLVIGDPGEGKSYLLADAAARISRGDFWPDGTRAPLGRVLFLSAEDGLADTMRPRLDTLGADVSRIHVLRSMNDPADPHRVFSLETDLPALQEAARTLQPVLIVIDPLSAYLGDRDSYKDSEMRRLLTPLVMFAEAHRVAVEAVMHLTKAADRRAIHRMIGSVAFSAISRLVIAVARDPNDEARRLVAGVKSNISTRAPALAFRLSEPAPGEHPTMTWEGVPVAGVTADRLLGPSSFTATARQSFPSVARGWRPARRPACPGGSSTTSAGQRFATWSARACRSVAMQMVGHKTEAIYRRYAIVSDADLRAAAVKLAAVSDAPKPATGTIAGTIGHSGAR